MNRIVCRIGILSSILIPFPTAILQLLLLNYYTHDYCVLTHELLCHHMICKSVEKSPQCSRPAIRRRYARPRPPRVTISSTSMKNRSQCIVARVLKSSLDSAKKRAKSCRLHLTRCNDTRGVRHAHGVWSP